MYSTPSIVRLIKQKLYCMIVLGNCPGEVLCRNLVRTTAEFIEYLHRALVQEISSEAFANFETWKFDSDGWAEEDVRGAGHFFFCTTGQWRCCPLRLMRTQYAMAANHEIINTVNLLAPMNCIQKLLNGLETWISKVGVTSILTTIIWRLFYRNCGFSS